MMVRAPRGRLAALALACAAAAAVTSGAAPTHASAARAEVAVIAPEGLRLADELKRELEISGFAVTMVVTPAAGREVKGEKGDTVGWHERVRSLAAAQPGRTVAVRADERQIVLLSRGAARSPGVQTSFELEISPEERSARRRACLTVVEYLRVLAESEERADGRERTPRPAAAVQATVEKSTSAADPTPAPPTAQDEVVTPVFQGLPWTMGVGTTIDFSTSGGRPAGHLQFMWYFPLGTRFAMRARVAWPILGADIHASDVEVRMWTFGAAVGLQYAFSEPPAPWRPFVGLAIGNLIALTESTSTLTAQARTGITPSAILGVEAGVRYAVAPRVQLLGELEGTRGWLGPTASGSSPEEDLASAVAVHASVGVLFEY